MDFNKIYQERKRLIDEKVKKELDTSADAYMQTKWDNILYKEEKVMVLPIYFLEDFRKSVMNTLPSSHQIKSAQLLEISKSEIKDLTFGQVGIVLTVYAQTLPCTISENFDAFIEKMVVVDELFSLYNLLSQDLNSNLLLKKQLMLGAYDPKTWELLPSSKFHA